MHTLSTMKYYSLAFYILLLFVEITSSGPCYNNNYENNDMAETYRNQEYQVKNRSLDVRDLYELLLKKQALEDQPSQSHQITRKANRSPSLRLRFGKKRDAYLTDPHLMGHPFYFSEDINN